MTPGGIGAFLLALVAVFVLGQVWFHLVEAVLEKVQRLFRPKEPPAWHPLPEEDAEKR